MPVVPEKRALISRHNALPLWIRSCILRLPRPPQSVRDFFAGRQNGVISIHFTIDRNTMPQFTTKDEAALQQTLSVDETAHCVLRVVPHPRIPKTAYRAALWHARGRFSSSTTVTPSEPLPKKGFAIRGKPTASISPANSGSIICGRKPGVMQAIFLHPDRRRKAYFRSR